MSGMVDRVAKAICEAVGDDWGDPFLYGGNDTPKICREKYRVQARAAIEAMSDPTDVMVDTGEYCFAHGGKSQRLRDLYKVMLDVASGKMKPLSLVPRKYNKDGSETKK